MRWLLFMLVAVLPVLPARGADGAAVKAAPASPQEDLDRLAEEIALVKQGDPSTVSRLAAELLADPGKGEALLYPNAAGVKTLPGLFDALPKASLDFPVKTGAISPAPTKTRIAGVILKVINDTEGFVPETKEWAKKTRAGVFTSFRTRQPGDEAKLAEMEEWWRNNGPAVIAGDLAAATWLPVRPQPSDDGGRLARRPPSEEQAASGGSGKPAARTGPGGGMTPGGIHPGVLAGVVIALVLALLAFMRLARGRRAADAGPGAP